MKFLAIVLILMVLAVPLPTKAQDEPTCEPDLTTIVDLFEEAQTALTDGELLTALDTLREIRMELSLIESQCSTLDIEGDSEILTDPIEIPEGIYRVTVTTEGYFIMNLTILEGECGQGSGSYLDANVFLVVEGRATEGAETVFTSLNCEVLIEYSNVTAPYSVTWEKIK